MCCFGKRLVPTTQHRLLAARSEPMQAGIGCPKTIQRGHVIFADREIAELFEVVSCRPAGVTS